MLNSKINIGRMDRVITFQQKEITVNTTFNSEGSSWEFFKKKYAQILEQKGDEITQADKITFVHTTTFLVRYDGDLNVEMRIVFNGKVYEIISMTEPEGTRKSALIIVTQYIEGEET